MPRGVQSFCCYQTLPGEEPFSAWDKSVLSLICGATYSPLIRKTHFSILVEILAEMELSEDVLKSRLCHSLLRDQTEEPLIHFRRG